MLNDYRAWLQRTIVVAATAAILALPFESACGEPEVPDDTEAHQSAHDPSGLNSGYPSTPYPEVSLPPSSDKLCFDGKVVILEVDSSTSLERKTETVILIQAKLLDLGDRWFVIGTYVRPNDEPDNERPFKARPGMYGLAWESVSIFYSLTPDQFQSYLDSRQTNKNAD